ncbi:MAG TPA: PilC/PilY family type IV pilus protein [Steroidobacter sp.]|uniref:pilus assembly protein n=1 Tax=Steroidobacter sp. TaxID=1978227 RepID=UPI002ED77E55
MLKQYMIRCWSLSVAAVAVLAGAPSQAADLNLSDQPLFLAPAVAPLNMLVVGRDHKLFYEAYNDASDLNGDGKIDVGYKGYLPNPTAAAPNNEGIDYYGYFDSYKCYTYGGTQFNPVRFTANKRCGGANEWSGDYLNYLTTSRIDALRKVLYGGKRATDTGSSTVLVRSHIPMDAHSWGKEYPWNAPAEFNIRDFTPFNRPSTGQRHLFANTTPNVGINNWADNNGPPQLRVLRNRTYRIWEWVSKESPVAGTRVAPAGGAEETVTFDNQYDVRVAVCTSAALIDTARNTENCRQYPNGNYKPTGLLHEFGENDSMMFGLLSGSYTANKSGGVLRKNVGSFTDEINAADGTFTDVVGIAKTLDNFRVAAYGRYTDNGGTSYDCGLPAMARGPIVDGNCRMWGNPVAEMMYETLRYFRGMSPTPAFTRTYGSGNTTVEQVLNLPRPAWQDPYSDAEFPTCAKPFQTVMTDINNSYDSDQLPGSRFGMESGSDRISDDLPGLDVGALADEITDNEPGIRGLHFIGQAGALYDGSPKPKDVTSLATIRGLAPEEPTKQGSYYPASVAYHGFTNQANPLTDDDVRVQTFAVALASPLPKIEIPVGGAGSGRFITLVPFAKSVVYNNEINRTEGAFQPTNQIVDFYVESIADDQRSGTFQVNFEDVEAGNDHDMDAIVRYSYRLTDDDTVRVDVSSDYQAGGIIHHIGYVISGTTADGVYLVVQDCNKDTNGNYTCNGTNDRDYFLDTPPGQGPGGNWADNVGLPGFSSRTFDARSGSTGATLLKDPLWYAAKWGGFKDEDDNDMPNLTSEWDANNDGDPDNYFLVTNALTLSQQLRETFTEITNRSASAASVSLNSGAISTQTRVYQARFDTTRWSGTLTAFGFDENNRLDDTPVWEASAQIPGPTSRNIITVNSNGVAVPFQWTSGIDDIRKAQLDADPAVAQSILNYIRGDERTEQRNGGPFRDRASKLGDIVASAPLYIGAPFGRYSDRLERAPYSEFLAEQRDRDGMVYVGANDGMLHAFKADDYRDGDGTRRDERGQELFAFIPKTVFGNLKELTRPSYAHKYFVDGAPNSGDAFINGSWRTVLVGGLNGGGQGIYALDVTNPNSLGASSVLWEINDQTSLDFRDLGYTFSQPAIGRLEDGTWVAVFGNGYNNTEPDAAVSTTGNGVLYMVNLRDGSLVKKFDTMIGRDDDPTGQNRPNGLATPALLDTDGDRIVDGVYVGDLFGNVWKIDLRGARNDWKFAYGTAAAPLPFFVAKDGTADNANRQPITSRIEVTKGPYSAGLMVLVGTGKYLEASDKTILPQRNQTFYGLYDANSYNRTTKSYDNGDRIASRSALTQQRILQEVSLGDGQTGRITTRNPLMGKGWYLDLLAPNNLYEGERVVSSPVVSSDRLLFTTLIPNSDPCGAGGRSWTMILDLLSGQMLRQAQIDSDGDGDVDNDDTPLSGVGQDGVSNGPTTGTCTDADCGADTLFGSNSNGDIDQRALRSALAARGRQSWRQTR